MSFDVTRRTLLATTGAAAVLTALPLRAQEDPVAQLEADGYAVGDQTLGDPDAPVEVIEYASLTCPHCASFHARTWPALKADYIESGQVHFIMREVYFDQFGLYAGMVSRAGGPEFYFDFIDAFLARQKTWLAYADGSEEGARATVAEIMKIGRQGGLSNERMEEALSNRPLLDHLVGMYQTNATADGVRSTPTFMINGEQYTGSVGPEEFGGRIDALL